MTGLLICAALATGGGLGAMRYASSLWTEGDKYHAVTNGLSGLALIAVALWLAYAAGGA